MQPLSASPDDAHDELDYLPDDAIEFAHRVGRVGLPTQISVARLVMQAAAPWSPAAHSLWPAAARAFVRFMLLVGQRVCYAARDVWIARVLPHVVRRSGPVSRSEMMDEAAYNDPDWYRTHYPWRHHEPLVW